MLALYRSGRQSEALDAYQQARKLLATELGLEPGRALQVLQAAILRQDAQLDPPAGPPSQPRRARRKSGFVVAIGAALLLTAAVALAGFKLTGGDSPRPPEILPNSLVRIDPKTRKPTDVVPIGDAPDGDVWVANCFVGGGANVMRVDAATLKFEATWSVPGDEGFYRGLAYGGGSLWLSDVFGPASDRRTRYTVTRVDPQTVCSTRFGLRGRRIPPSHGRRATATCG